MGVGEAIGISPMCAQTDPEDPVLPHTKKKKLTAHASSQAINNR